MRWPLELPGLLLGLGEHDSYLKVVALTQAAKALPELMPLGCYP